jgi:hypothetical protein
MVLPSCRFPATHMAYQREPAKKETHAAVCSSSIQFANAKINENTARSIVTGVNSRCSSLFFEIAFPNVFNRNNPVISHNAYVIIFLGISIAKKFACTRIIITNTEFIKMEKISNRYISLSVFNLPPQTRLYGIIFNRIRKCNKRNRDSKIKSPSCAMLTMGDTVRSNISYFLFLWSLKLLSYTSIHSSGVILETSSPISL